MSGGATLNRKTQVVFDPPETVLGRPPWSAMKTADRIGRAAAVGSLIGTQPFTAPANTMLVPGPAWIMRPDNMDPVKVSSTSGPAAILTGELNLAATLFSTGFFQAPTDLPGLGAGGSLISTATGALRRRVAATGTAAVELTADVAVMSKPVNNTDLIAMDRVASGQKTYPGNTAFRLVFILPPTLLMGPSDLCTFYFGGPADIWQGAPTRAGEFAVHLTTLGRATLYEYVEGDVFTGWKQRLNFRYAQGGMMSASLHTLDIIPLARDCILFHAAGTDFATSPVDIIASAFSPLGAAPAWTTYRENSLITGIDARASITGPGIVRLDLRRDLLIPFWMFAMQFPAPDGDGYGGYLVDEPFQIPTTPLPAATPITDWLDQFQWQDTNIATDLHDADTNTALSRDFLTNSLESVLNQNRYYARYKFQASADRYSTPVLFAAGYSIEGTVAHRTGTSVTGGNLRSVNLTGPDLDPSHESGRIEIEDLRNQLTLLDQRGRVGVLITTQYDVNPALKSNLFFGEVASTQSTKHGRSKGPTAGGGGTPMLHPSPNWRNRELTLVGHWARLKEQILLSDVSFAHAPPSDPGRIDPQTKKILPWKVTDAMKLLLAKTGVEPAAMDIEDLSIRLFPVQQPEDLSLRLGKEIAEALAHFCLYYLRRFLLYDKNAQGPGATNVGMWRLPRKKKASDPPLWSFEAGHPGAGKDPIHPGSWPAETTFILDESYYPWVVAPEFNVLTVTGTGELMPGSGGKSHLTQLWYNPFSFDVAGHAAADPTNVDYLGREVRHVFFSPLLATEQAVRWFRWSLIDYAGHGEKWARFVAPLVLVLDPTDGYQINPRPLRIGDRVNVLGVEATVRSCNPSYDHDPLQFATYEVRYFV